MGKLYGYAGKLLRVDLTNEKLIDEPLDEATARKWIGGSGLGAKILYDEVPAGVEWNDPGNRMTIASGPLGGSRVGGTGTVSVVTKGALTNGSVASQANGFFGAFIRFCGYDGIILQGKAKRWLYLHISDDSVELKDASHLLGKDVWETTDTIKKEYGKHEHEMSVMTIGPAGENLVKFASVFFDKGHAASHNGTGAVVGSKRLKAIAVDRGKKHLDFKDPDGVKAAGKAVWDWLFSTPVGQEEGKWGTLQLLVNHHTSKSGTLPVKNYSEDEFKISQEKLAKFSGPYLRKEFQAKPDPCYSCRMHHCHKMTLTEGPYKGYSAEEPEYEGFAAFGPVIGNDDSSIAFYLANEADRLGMDVNETGWVMGLAIECFEKGIITSNNSDGLELNWGNYKAVHQLLEKIARRDGFGNTMAEGAMRAARIIGGEAVNFFVGTMKGNTPRGHDDRGRWGKLLDTCISQMGTDEGFNVPDPEDVGYSPGSPPSNPFTAVSATTGSIRFKGGRYFEDSCGTCWQTTRTHLQLLSNGIRAATGWDFTPKEALAVGERTNHILRAFNIRHGHTPEMDTPSPRYGSAHVIGMGAGQSILPDWNQKRRMYYKGIGWDEESGKPLPETLRNYGLEYAVPELWGKE